jgi:hypothetical protein
MTRSGLRTIALHVGGGVTFLLLTGDHTSKGSEGIVFVTALRGARTPNITPSIAIVV